MGRGGAGGRGRPGRRPHRDARPAGGAVPDLRARRAAWRRCSPPGAGTFAASQTHWYRLAGGRIIGHAANRDDLAQARQLGWVPPSPAFLLRSALARRRLRRTTAG